MMRRTASLFCLLTLSLAAAQCRRGHTELLERLPRFAREWTDSVSLRQTTLRALTPPLPSTVNVWVQVPELAFLDFAVAVIGPQERPPRIEFTLSLKDQKQHAILYRDVVRPRDANRWNHQKTDLSAWKGKRVELVFETRLAPGQQDSVETRNVRTAWGNPVLRSRQPAAKGVERPSVVLVLVDALRRDALGAYGFEGDVSPALDRLAMESLLFENCYTVAPWTRPAVASLFTSLHPLSHGVTGRDAALGVLPSEAFTLAEALRDHGYETAAFVANPHLSSGQGFSQGFGRYELLWGSDELLSAAGHWIRDLPEGRPFFVYLHLMDTHAPYDKAEPEDFEAVARSRSLGDSRLLTDVEFRTIPRHMRRSDTGHEERQDLKAWRASYAAGVRSLDRRLAPFLERLRTSGALDHAYLLLTADHGEEFLEHGEWEHGYNLHEPTIRIPLLVRRPRAQDAGRRVPALASLVDLMPTILALTGVVPPPALQGTNQADLVKGRAAPELTAVFSSSTENRPSLNAVVTRDHKAIVDVSTGEVVLFDLAADPDERHDLAKANPALAQALSKTVSDHLAALSARQYAPQQADVPDEIRERLKALGYLR